MVAAAMVVDCIPLDALAARFGVRLF